VLNTVFILVTLALAISKVGKEDLGRVFHPLLIVDNLGLISPGEVMAESQPKTDWEYFTLKRGF